MKFSPTCMVFAAFAIAAALVRADSPVSTSASALGDAFSRLIKTQTLIKEVQKRNNDFLSPELSLFIRELPFDLKLDIIYNCFKMYITLRGVNLMVGQIAEKTMSVTTEIDSVALAVRTAQSNDARIDYEIKKGLIQKLCEDTLAKANACIAVIDETKVMIAKDVIDPLRIVKFTILNKAHEVAARTRANLEVQEQIINNPFNNIRTLFTGYDAKEAAMAWRQEDLNIVVRITKLLISVFDHAVWLESACKVIRQELDYVRVTIAGNMGSITGARGSFNAIVNGFNLFADSHDTSDIVWREGSKALRGYSET